MTQLFTIKRGDTSPRLLYALQPSAEIDLTGATVRFSMRSRALGTLRVNRQTALIIIATGTPTVAYDWKASETTNAETCEAEFEVTYASGAVETFPNADFITVLVTSDIA
jgi:hypothetical protein